MWASAPPPITQPKSPSMGMDSWSSSPARCFLLKHFYLHTLAKTRTGHPHKKASGIEDSCGPCNTIPNITVRWNPWGACASPHARLYPI
jgi:hypothetical protein